MSGAWVCDACAERLALAPNGGGSFSGGGWCGVGQHRLPAGQRVVWHASVPDLHARPDVGPGAPRPAPTAAAKPQQLELF